MKAEDKYFLVSETILPEAIKKTAKVKELLKNDDSLAINEAVKRFRLSRSAFYKYKDCIFPFYQASKDKIITLSFFFLLKAGVLSLVLNSIAAERGSIITINQGIPLQGVAHTTISIDTKQMRVDVEALLDKLGMINGVKRIEILGQG
ncbi:MAG: ACT domain-containing protein [Acidaminococcaceae bacterium]|nr:ACT domain-containing protein [Acidaminococcaceae bacterium]